MGKEKKKFFFQEGLWWRWKKSSMSSMAKLEQKIMHLQPKNL